MENGEHWVFECDIDIKSEPEEYIDESNKTETSLVIETEPSTSNAVNTSIIVPYVVERKRKIRGVQYDECDKFSFESEHVSLSSNSRTDASFETGTEPSTSDAVHTDISFPYRVKRKREILRVEYDDCDKFNSESENVALSSNSKTDSPFETGTEPRTSNAVHTDIIVPHVVQRKRRICRVQYNDSDKLSFESEHESLSSNSKKLLEGIYILEKQRVQAIKELDELYELLDQALSDPNGFLEKLQNHNVNFSDASNIHELPVINWRKYELNFSASRIRRQQIKLAAKINDLKKKVCDKKRSDEGNSLWLDERPKQRYKLWTAEEQKKLEELLIQFPPEDIETRRYEKIAKFLVDRTPGQIAGRVKKYFKTLKKHGIPAKNGVPNHDHIKKPCSCLIGPNPNTHLISHQPPIYNPDGNEVKSNELLDNRRKFIKRYNFNYWTDNEQKKLDDLLIQFPPEEVESSRWEKIAKHLETRTPFQIASRVKYLKLLMLHGKFVPGKIPGIHRNEVQSAEYTRYSHGSNIMQYWTPEEHNRLEELLLMFPPEKHENERWKKIAYCLGNRTPAQVASKAKNYFIKCKKYGLPVLGRVPRAVSRFKLSRRKGCRVIYNANKCMESCQPPSTEENTVQPEMNASAEKDINEELKCIEKGWVEKNPSELAHIGFICSKCKVEPIMGIRWHCTECRTQSVDFCSACSTSEYKEVDGHSFDHTLEAIKEITH